MQRRVGLLEDEDLMRLTLSSSLTSGGHEIVCDAGSVAEFLAKSTDLEMDVAVLDINLGPGPTGIDAANVLRARNPNIGIIFLTSYDDPRLASNDPEIPSGSIYLIKRDIRQIETLLEAVSNAQGNSDYDAPVGTLAHLSANQIAVLRLVAAGASNSEIARQRFITERTVETTIYRIAKTLGISQAPNQNQRVTMAKAYFRASGMKLDG